MGRIEEKVRFTCVCFLLTVADRNSSWERSHSAIQILKQLIPNFQKKIDEDSPEELHMFYAEVSGASFQTTLTFSYMFLLASAGCRQC